MTVDQYVFGEVVHTNAIKPGDLIFSTEGGSKVHHQSIEWLKGTKVPEEGIDHVGVYVGDGMVAHSSHNNKDVGPDGGVFIEKLEGSRFTTIVGIRRIKELSEERFLVTIPPERFDLRIESDIAEEVVRLMGYDKVPVTSLVVDGFTPIKNGTYDAMIRARNALAALGFSEIFTYVFRKEGQVQVANPTAEGVRFLRDNLSAGMREALVFNARNAPLLGLDEILMFEIGTVFFSAEKESIHISVGATVTKNMKQSKREERIAEILALADKALEDAFGKKLSWEKDGNVWERNLPLLETVDGGYESLISTQGLPPYRAISSYPFILRDIALWSNNTLSQEEILNIIRMEAGPLLVHDRLFDVFTKENDGARKTSYAFNLVFQAYDRTLSDAEINEIMAHLAGVLAAKGLEVR